MNHKRFLTLCFVCSALVFLLCLLPCSASQTGAEGKSGGDIAGADVPPVIRYDFESGTEGWRPNSGLKGIPSVRQTCDRAKTGRCSLYLTLDLAPSQQCGEVYVDLPLTDLDGTTITAWVYAPPAARGTDPNHPNGLHLFAKDRYWRNLYGTWKNIQEGGWTKVALPVVNKVPACGSMSNSFDPSQVRQIGLNVCAGEGTTYQGFLLLDTVAFESALSPLDSDHLYDFESPEVQQRMPHWDINPGWGAAAWSEVEVRGGALVADAHFNLSSDARRKGFVGITYSPWLNLAHKDHAQISVDIKFVPTAVAMWNNCPFVVSLWAYDDHKRKWFTSDYQNVGSDEWTTVTFDLNNPAEYAPGVQDYEGDLATLSHIRQLGIQLWANRSYDGQVMFDNIVVGGRERTYPNLNQGMVMADGSQFTLDGEPFCVIGANAEYLYVSPDSVIEEVLDLAQSMGATVLRVWGLGSGCENKATPDCAIWSRRFQPSRGLYNEMALENFDRVVAMAGERGIRLIVALVNNWDEYGGMPQYVEWLAEEHPSEIPPGVEPGTDEFHDLFYVKPQTIQWYQSYVTQFISRTNSITGIRYSEDPTIFAWELANEPRAKSDVSGATLHRWVVQMSDFIEALDPNHMIGTGEEGWYVMTKASADARSRLPDGTLWQELPNNYWHYGVNWIQDSNYWGSNGVDFVSDHSSTVRSVCWQDYVSQSSASPVECESRQGVPNIDFATLHLYISSGACNLYHAPYCEYGFDDVLCNSEYDRPYNQAWLWMQEHVQDAHSVIGKPVLLEEFGFRVSASEHGSSSGETPGHIPPFTKQHRPQLYQLYLKAADEMGFNGALFWNLGYVGFTDMPWDDCDCLDNWQTDASSDAVGLALVNGPSYITRGRYAFRLEYDPSRGFGKAFVDRVNVNENWLPDGETPLTRLAVDVCNPGAPISGTIALVTGNGAVWHEARPRPVPGHSCTTIAVDAQEHEWKSAATNWEYTGKVQDLEMVRRVSVGFYNYASPGTVYIDYVRHRFDDSLVIYADDPVTSVIAFESMRCRGLLNQTYLPIVLRNLSAN